MAGCPPIDPYRQPSADELANSLLRRLIPTVDAARAVGVRLGLRQYEVRIIRTQWTGEFRGEGEEFLVDERPLTPTPLVMGLDTVNRVFESVGAIEEGQGRAAPAWLVTLTDQLKGQMVREPAKEELPRDINVQIIVEFYSR